jgi:integrase
MSKKAKRARQWPPIYNFPNRSGQPTYYVDLRAVNGGRPGYPTREQAQTRAEQARVDRENEGTLAFSLPADVRLDAAKAHQLLQPHAITILEAAKYYQKHVLAYKSAPNIKAIVDRYIKDSITRNLRGPTIKDLDSRLNTFADDFGHLQLSDIALDELKDWINDEEWEPRTRINYRTKISQLYGHAIRNKWADANITEHIQVPKVDETTPDIFTVDEAKQLLLNAPTFGLLPYIAIGLFSGIRFAELTRLDGKDVKFDDKIIRIGPEVAKKRSQRNINIQEALLHWIEPYKKQLEDGGPLVNYNTAFRTNKDLLLEAAGISEWKANGLRHSFGSYHLAKFKNIEDTAYQMGNSVDMVHKHYKALVTPSESEAFWALRRE